LSNRTWTTEKLGECFHIKHGYAFKGEFFGEEGSHVLLTPGNFNEEGGLKLKGKKEKYYSGPIPDEFVLRRGDLLIAMTDLKQSAPILGSAAMIPKSNFFLHNQRLGKIVQLDERKLTKEYLYYLFNSNSVRAHIKGSATGTTVRHTAPERIYKVVVDLPPLTVQRKIASILSAYDELIGNNTRRIEILEDMALAFYREWFVNVRFPGHEKTKLVDSAFGRIPATWMIKSFGDISENFDSKRKPLSSMERANMKGEYPYYGAARVFDYINDYIFDGKYLLVAEDGSVITTTRKPVLQFVNGKFWANNHTHIIQGRPPVSTEFLYLFMRELDIAGYVTGAAQPKITQANLNRIPIAIADEATLNSFDNHVTPIISLIDKLSKHSQHLRRTRDLLLPKLISGELTLSSTVAA
jgi:type I restriction enzyme, S subunit